MSPPSPGAPCAVDPPVVGARVPTTGSGGGARAPAIAVTIAVAFAHGVNDVYTSFLHPLLPRIMEKLGLSIALAAALVMILSLAASVLQPLLGYLADRFGRRLFVALGPLFSAVFLSIMGLAPTFATLAVLLILGGLGSAAFHPPGASMAARVRDRGRSGLRLSFFSFGGTLGFGLGPLVAVVLVTGRGLGGLWIAMIPGVLVAILLLLLLPPGREDRSTAAPPRAGAILASLAGPLGLVFGISALGAFLQRTFLTLQPISVAEAGGSEALGALFLSVYLLAQGGGTLVSGYLTDRVDRRTLLVGITLLACPAHLLAVGMPVDSAGALGAAAAAGFLSMALLPPVVVVAQELHPDGAGLSSGIVMGLAWATGSVGVLGAGALADAVGARGAAMSVMPAILLGTALALHPALRPHRRAS